MASTRFPEPASIQDITLTTPHHDTVALGSRIAVPTVVILARYFG
ncbi:hypothetical protein MNBD_ACTINO01-7 [hydrothermal vent metagenome]|uniref:Uncharacterized protein n=1 Tax=hydrothermal vent metagenome TaxID=652676 RepID=A0A3B0S780_9ZZZZ